MICRIIKKEKLLDDLYSFWIHAPGMAEKATAGQFVHVLCGDGVLLRRPISICDTEGENLRFVMGVKGKGTALLSQKKEGDDLDVLGPLGRGFDLEKRGEGTALVIGGGIGVFPLLKLSKSLSNNVEAILGFRSKELLSMERDFTEAADKLHIATDDGSYGFHGLVTQVAEQIINNQQVGSIFACGPTPMLKAIKKLAAQYDLPCQLSLEERMGCGIGVCMTCVCKTKNGQYAPVCKTGPVFMAEEVDFDA